MVIKVISFDVDGTLVDASFADLVWREGMPRLLAAKEGITFQEAREILDRRYDDIGEEDLRWYLPGYWWEDLDLPGTPEDLIREYAHRVEVFPEVEGVLQELMGEYELIACSNAAREFLEVSLLDLCGYFGHTFSSTTDFQMVRKFPDFYRHVCTILKVRPGEVVHVGDHPKFDYQVPRASGMTAYHLDRSGDAKGRETVGDLREFRDALAGLD
ncbi:MAG: HAD family hydrolase [Acidobacteria bacterium]|nr:HAD family hydrolase [Acidobacteriota bacterium]